MASTPKIHALKPLPAASVAQPGCKDQSRRNGAQRRIARSMGMNGRPNKERRQKGKNVRLQKRHEQLEKTQENHADHAGRRHQEKRPAR